MNIQWFNNLHLTPAWKLSRDSKPYNFVLLQNKVNLSRLSDQQHLSHKEGTLVGQLQTILDTGKFWPFHNQKMLINK